MTIVERAKKKWNRMTFKKRLAILVDYYGKGKEASINYVWYGYGGNNSYWSKKKWEVLPISMRDDLEGEF